MANGGGKNRMNTVDRIVHEISQKLASSIVEATNYKVLYEETNEENKRINEEYQRVNELLSKFNDVLDSDQALKDLFDEASQKLEEGK